MRTLSYSERIDLHRQIQETCKTKGEYAKRKFPTFESFIDFFSRKCGSMKNSIFLCIRNIKNFINEYLKWAQDKLEVGTEYSLVWFKAYLNLILKAANHGIKMAESFFNKILRRKLPTRVKEGKGDLTPWGATKATFKMSKAATFTTASMALGFGGIMLGILVAVVDIALAWWLRITNRVDMDLRTKPTLMEKIKGYYSRTFGDDSGDLPDELLPPEPEVPNVTMSFINESEELKEDPMTIGAGLLFILFLKASVASTYNEEMAQKAAILRSAIPSPASLAFTGLLLYFASHSTAFLSAV